MTTTAERALELVAPCDGWAMPATEIPDAAFAGQLLGPTFAVDPLEGLVRAPCDGEVSAVAPTRHSVTLRHACEAEVLVHAGIDTVAMGGEGFEALVAVGAQVVRGTPLLRFDLDRVVRTATSAMTPVVVLDEHFRFEELRAGHLVRAGERIAVLVRAAGNSDDAPAPSGAGHARSVRVLLPHGVHARPAAAIVSALKPLTADVSIRTGDRVANARSVTALLKADIRNGALVTIEAAGPGAAEACEALAKLLTDGAEDARPTTPAPAAREDAAPTPGVVTGIRAAPGGAIGVAARLAGQDLAIDGTSGPPGQERAALADAIRKLRGRLEAERDGSGIAGAHLAVLDDPDLQAAMERGIEAGMGSAAACRAALRAEAEALRASANPLLAERAADMRDVERQLVAAILGVETGPALLPESAIVLADELLPSEFLSLDATKLVGLATARGGPTSHVAILAAARGLPMLVGCGDALLAVPDGTPLLIAPLRPALLVEPDAGAVARFRSDEERHRLRAAAQVAAAATDCVTADGRRIEVFANCASAEEASLAVANGAEGCGLLRSEFLFLHRQEPPTEAEQVEAYGAIARALEGRPLIVRTLDAGSDKPLPYLALPPEENPALGLRGVRVSLARPELLARQFRAILRAVPSGQCRIMLPMIVDLSEFRAARDVLRRVEADLAMPEATPLGVMIETPAAALLAGQLAGEADFLSIGSNDLTQYALAADRQNAAVSALADPLHPAVLRLVALAADGARAHGRPLGLCGALASDPAAAAILVGLGIDEFSASPPSVAAVKARIRALDSGACRHLAERALQATDAAEVRALIEEANDAPAL